MFIKYVPFLISLPLSSYFISYFRCIYFSTYNHSVSCSLIIYTYLVNALQCYNCDKNALLTGVDTCGDLSLHDNTTKTCAEAERFCVQVTATPSTSIPPTPTQKLGCAGEIETVLTLFTGTTALQNICDKTPENGCKTLPYVPAAGFFPGLKNIKICCCSTDL